MGQRNFLSRMNLHLAKKVYYHKTDQNYYCNIIFNNKLKKFELKKFNVE